VFWHSYVSFDGVNDYINVPDDSTLDGFTTSSYAFWVRVPDTNAMWVLDKWDSYINQRSYAILLDSPGRPRLAYSSDGTAATYGQQITNGTQVSPNVWTHVLFNHTSSTNIDIYINGVEVPSTRSGVTPTSIFNSTAPLEMGRDAGLVHHDYNLADVRIYNRALTTSEISHIYTAGASGTNPGTTNLVAHYKLNEGQGHVVNDDSGKGNIGTAYGIEEPGFWNQPHASFDGVDDAISLHSHIANFSGLSTGSVSAWFKFTGAATNPTQTILAIADKSTTG
jgi:hypothetical protein